MVEANKTDRDVAERLAGLQEAITQAVKQLPPQAPVAETQTATLAGCPTYTPVGTIEVKQYPEYRMASGPGFSTLLRHNTSNRTEMTAPARMAYNQAAQGELREANMAFLHGDTKTGRNLPASASSPSCAAWVSVIYRRRCLPVHDPQALAA